MKTARRRLRGLALASISWLIPFAALEISSIIFLKERVRQFNPEYLKSGSDRAGEGLKIDLGRGYPRHYFADDGIKGFDIQKNFKPEVVSTKPSESIPYEIWSNSIGCYDKEPTKNKPYKVYLAGDSFTWGYTPYKKKFGTLLEHQLGVPVAKCGVTHTGQAHQLEKLKEVRRLTGHQPETVIVNIYYNDIDNDFSHPHSRVINGYLVDRIQNKFLSATNFCTLFMDKSTLEEMIKRPRTFRAENKAYFNPSNQSAAISIIRFLYRRIFNSNAECLDSNSNEFYGVYSPINRLYAYSPYQGYPINSAIAKNNRKAIIDWIKDSKHNNYRLIFSFIDIGQERSYGDELRRFIELNGGEFHAFGDHIETRSIEYRNSLRWKHDGHFNEKGNAAYADYLFEILNKQNSSI